MITIKITSPQGIVDEDRLGKADKLEITQEEMVIRRPHGNVTFELNPGDKIALFVTQPD